MEHPYKDFESTELWTVVKKALKELIKNQDIEITTKEDYVIGYLCKKILKTRSKDLQNPR